MRFVTILLTVTMTVTVNVSWADVRYDVKESVSGHPMLVKRAGFRRQTVFFSGSKTATLENDFLTIADQDQDELVVIDRQTQRFARGRLKGTMAQQRQTFFDALPAGLRLAVLEAGVADTWNGLAVERTIRTLALPAALSGLPADAEFRTTEFSSAELPGWDSIMAKRAGDDQRWSQELAAMIATMAVKDVQLHQDVLKARTSMKTLSLPVRTISDFRLTPGPGQDGEEVQALSGGSLMRIEREVSGLSADSIDSDTFRVPASFQLIEMDEMLAAKVARSVR